MKKVNKKYIFLLIILLLSIKKLYDSQVVKNAISLEEAQQIVSSEKNCYIIEGFEGGFGEAYQFAYGEHKGKIIIPPDWFLDKFKAPFVFPAKNKFLIRGSELKPHKASENDLYDLEFEIEIFDWEIIAPIERDYTFAYHFRFFSPRNHIDLYDLRHGDFKP